MKRSYLMTLGLILLGAHGVTYAQVHPCSGPSPTEEVVGTQSASSGVAPIPLCRTISGGTNGDQPGRSLGSGVTYEKTWGAIATSHEPDVKERTFSGAINKPTRDEAEQAALSLCQKRENSTSCKVELSYENGCGAIAYGVSDLFAKSVTTKRMPAILGTDPTLEFSPQTEQAALDACTQGGGHDCKVIYSACSGPAVRKSKGLIDRLFH